MAKKYHNNHIETHELIIKHHTIRFNRLDQVDDMEESLYPSGPINLNLSKYVYVSCWTKSKEENLALWKMYAGYRGIRISLDETMFVSYPYEYFETFMSYFPKMLYFGDGFMADQMSNHLELLDVNYVDSPKNKINSLLTLEDNKISINTNELGRYKRKEWAVQKESRFKIQVLPLNYNYVPSYTKEALNSMDRLELTKANFEITPAIIQSIKESYVPSQTYMDMPLLADALDNIEIMMGPSTNEADRYIVDNLLSNLKYAKVEDSSFKGIIVSR